MLTLSASQSALAQSDDTCGLMVMAHGGGQTWDEAVQTAVAPLEKDIPTAIAFGMANPVTMAASVAELEEQGVDCIAVVRLFVSAQSFLHQTEYLLGLREDAPRFFVMMPQHGTGHDPEPIPVHAQVQINHDGLMDAPQMGRVLAERALSMRDTSRQDVVIVIAHGPGDDDENEMWLGRLSSLADSIRATGAFEAVEVHTLREDWEEKRAVAEEGIRSFVAHHTAAGARVLVVPFRLFGFGPYAKVLEGLTYESNGQGLLPSPHVTDWIKSQYYKTVAELSEETQEIR